MLYKIADLIVEIPDAGGMAPRCQEYRYDKEAKPDIVIYSERYKNNYGLEIDEEMLAYKESAKQFSTKLLRFDGIYLHASAVELEGRAYLFSGPCGMGKSTHTRLWQQTFGSAARVINDDKPTLRRVEDRWYVYGTPWCGKDGINQNRKVPLAGICFLKQAQRNTIRRLDNKDAIKNIILQTLHKFSKKENLELMLKHVERLVVEVPMYMLENRPEPEAAQLSYKIMRNGAEEAGL